MEHRCSERFATDLKILIYREGMPVAIGRIRNGSKLGFFIETDFAEVKVLQPLDVEILLYRSPHNIVRHKYTTRVIRKTASGLGVELETMSTESAKVLVDLLRSPQARQQSFKVLQEEVPNAVKSAKKVQAS